MEKRAYANDFPLAAVQSGRHGWTGGDANDSEDDEVEVEAAADRETEPVDENDDTRDVQVWSAADADDSLTAAELLDDAEDVADKLSNAVEDSTPETHLERSISALQAANSSL